MNGNGTLKLTSFVKGSDDRYGWPGAVQIKGSVCHSNGLDLVSYGLCVMAAMPTVLSSTPNLPTF